jgi:hypothetical protein
VGSVILSVLLFYYYTTQHIRSISIHPFYFHIFLKPVSAFQIRNYNSLSNKSRISQISSVYYRIYLGGTHQVRNDQLSCLYEYPAEAPTLPSYLQEGNSEVTNFLPVKCSQNFCNAALGYRCWTCSLKEGPYYVCGFVAIWRVKVWMWTAMKSPACANS